MTWVNSGIKRSDLAENGMQSGEINDHAIILTLIDNDIIAFSARCPHAAGDLQEGSLYRGRIDCPVHGWRFDVRTGRTLFPEDENLKLKKFPTKVESGIVWVEIG